MVSYDALGAGIMEGDGEVVEREVNKALDEGCQPRDILVKGIIGGMVVVGERFGVGDRGEGSKEEYNQIKKRLEV